MDKIGQKGVTGNSRHTRVTKINKNKQNGAKNKQKKYNHTHIEQEFTMGRDDIHPPIFSFLTRGEGGIRRPETGVDGARRREEIGVVVEALEAENRGASSMGRGGG